MADVSYDRWELYYTRADDGIWITDGTARICLGFDATVRDAIAAVAAGSERERVTALWREAAAAVDQIDAQARDDDAWTYSEELVTSLHIGPCAECGRLREQLDAARQALDAARQALNQVGEPLCDAVFRTRLLRQGLSNAEIAQYVEAVEAMQGAARAALRFVGEEDDE